MFSLAELFSTRFFMPHGHCYLWKPALLWLQVVSNSLIGIAYVAISATLAYLVYKVRDIPFKAMYLAFGIFIITCGITHFFDVYVIWTPSYWADGFVRAVTALASVGTAFLLPSLIPKAVALARGAKAAHDRGIALETVVKDLGTMYEKTKELEQLKTQFFANVSHELRTPLALIIGPVERLLRGATLAESQRRDIEVVARNGRALLRQVNDLLDVSKLEAGKMEVRLVAGDLARVVRLTAANFEPLAQERGIAFSVDAPAELPAAFDPEKIERVLLNLLSNAFKFTPTGGTVQCALSVAEGEAQVTVADSGPGIPHDLREVVFERFRQLDGGSTRRFGGTGLGLAISRDFVGLHGGQIEVEDAPTRGALFRVTLPLRRAAGTPISADVLPPAESSAARDVVEQLRVRREMPTPAPGAAPGAPTVLVIEDNPEMRRFVAESLAPAHDVRTAEDGEAGLAEALRLRPDCIVSDVMMPRLSGDRMLTEIRARRELDGVPVVFLTAKAEDELRIRLLRGGAQDYLTKPFSVEELRVRVSNQITMKRTRDILQTELASQVGDLERLATEVSTRRRDLAATLEALQLAHHRTEEALAAKRDFLSLVSHELKTPLTALALHLEHLRNRAHGEFTEHHHSVIDRLRTSSERLSGLVDSLLEFSRVDRQPVAPQIGAVDARAVVAAVVDEMGPLAEQKGLALELLAPAQLRPIATDPALLRVIVENLVGNAVKFTDRGRVSVALSESDAGLEVRVSDTGPGITAENLPRIFEPFTHLEPLHYKHTPGFGLGLALVKQIVEALRGEIRVETAPGTGSTFTVRIPSMT